MAFWKRFAFASPLLLLLFGVACDLKTSVDYDRTADFSEIKTYAWAGRQHPEVSDLVHKRVLAAIDAQLELKEVSGAFVIDQYQVALSIMNRSPVPVDRLTVTMTLFDREGHVTGLRQVYLDPDRRLEPGASLALTLKVIPQGPDTVTFDAFAEGRPVTN